MRGQKDSAYKSVCPLIHSVLFSDNMYDPKTAKAEASQRSLLKIVDGGHVLADHSFDHMNHNSNDSPRNAYTNVEQDMVSCSSVLLTYLLQNSKNKIFKTQTET